MNKFWSLAWRYGGIVNYLTNLLCLMILSGGSVHFPRPKRTESAALSLSDDLRVRNSVTNFVFNHSDGKTGFSLALVGLFDRAVSKTSKLLCPRSRSDCSCEKLLPAVPTSSRRTSRHADVTITMDAISV